MGLNLSLVKLRRYFNLSLIHIEHKLDKVYHKDLRVLHNEEVINVDVNKQNPNYKEFAVAGINLAIFRYIFIVP